MVSSIVFLTEVPHHACALNIPICPTSTTMGSPWSFPGTLDCFRQFTRDTRGSQRKRPWLRDESSTQANIQHVENPLSRCGYAENRDRGLPVATSAASAQQEIQWCAEVASKVGILSVATSCSRHTVPA